MSDTKPQGARKIAGITVLILAGCVLLGGIYFAGTDQSNQASAQKKKINKEISDAVSYGQAGDYKRALALLKQITDKHPKNTDGLYNYGVALRGVQSYAAADKVFQRLLEINPKDYEAIAERANLAVLQNDIEAGFDFLEQIPRGEGQLILRLRTDPQWKELERHPRMAKIRSLQGLTKLNYQ